MTESLNSMIIAVSPAARADEANMKGSAARVVSAGPEVVVIAKCIVASDSSYAQTKSHVWWDAGVRRVYPDCVRWTGVSCPRGFQGLI
jgi:hypothetical protein